MSRATSASLKRMQAANNGDWDEVERLEAEEAAAQAAKAKAKAKVVPADYEDRSLARRITDSSLYDGQPVARFLLVQLAVLAMKENSEYPDDAPAKFKADKVGWCWMGQVPLSLKLGTDSDGRTVRNWIAQFRKDEVIQYRDWYDDNGTHHAEYKVIESVVDAFQRPAKKKDAIAARPKRYSEERKGNKGSFSTSNQPGRSAQCRAITEEDDE